MGLFNWLGSVLGLDQQRFSKTNAAGGAGQSGAAETKESKEKSMNVSSSAQAYHNNMVGPVMRAGDLALAVIEAAKLDNPGKEVVVDDKRAYLRIHTEQEMILRRQTIEDELGRPFKMNDLEVDLSSFAGQIESGDDSVRFYFAKRV